MFFENGDRVYYVSGKHFLQESNPLKGSKFECEGTVTSPGTYSHERQFSIRVGWDNGTGNTYNDGDLELISTYNKLGCNNPNRVFQLRKGKRKKKGGK